MVALKACLLAAVVSVPADIEVVKFTSQFCAPCRAMEPILQQVESQGVRVTRVDIDQRRDIADKYQVTSVPTLFLVRQGKVLERMQGATSAEHLFARLAAHGPSVTRQAGSPSARDAIPHARRDVPYARPSQPRDQGDVEPASYAASTTAAEPDAQRVEERAYRATVRIRVEDPQGESSGTGTIVDVHQDEALVLTCGHLFRDSEGRGQISVDVFAEARPRTVTGKLVQYDLKRDLALVVVPIVGIRVDAVPVAGPAFHVAQGQHLFSVGCNEGDDPTVMRGQLKAINKYLGPENLVVSGRPIYGRSGGGLFSYDGRLVGVCNAADPELNEGLYAAYASIHRHLDDAKLSFVYRGSSEGLAANEHPPGNRSLTPLPRTATPLASDAAPLHQPSRAASWTSTPHPTTPNSNLPNSNLPNADMPWLAQGARGAEPEEAEVICIIRSKRGSDDDNKVVVLDRPSREFLQRLTDEQREQAAREMTQARTTERSRGLHRSQPRQTLPR